MRNKKGIAVNVLVTLIVFLVIFGLVLLILSKTTALLSPTTSGFMCGFNVRIKAAMPPVVREFTPLSFCTQYNTPIEINAANFRACPGLADFCNDNSFLNKFPDVRRSCVQQCARIQVDQLTQSCWSLAGEGRLDLKDPVFDGGRLAVAGVQQWVGILTSPESWVRIGAALTSGGNEGLSWIVAVEKDPAQQQRLFNYAMAVSLYLREELALSARRVADLKQGDATAFAGTLLNQVTSIADLEREINSGVLVPFVKVTTFTLLQNTIDRIVDAVGGDRKSLIVRCYRYRIVNPAKLLGQDMSYDDFTLGTSWTHKLNSTLCSTDFFAPKELAASKRCTYGGNGLVFDVTAEEKQRWEDIREDSEINETEINEVEREMLSLQRFYLNYEVAPRDVCYIKYHQSFSTGTAGPQENRYIVRTCDGWSAHSGVFRYLN